MHTTIRGGGCPTRFALIARTTSDPGSVLDRIRAAIPAIAATAVCVLALLALPPATGSATAAERIEAAAAAAAAAAAEGIAMHGSAVLAKDAPLSYADPEAPQGGTITFGALGTFDNLNPLIPRGARAPGLRDTLYGNLVYESLLDRNFDEPFSLYPFLANAIAVPDARDAATFTIAEGARFSDGTPITSADVAFSLDLLKAKGWPYARTYYAKVESVETPDDRTIVFSFPNANDRELPLILGLMPILPRHATDAATFERTTLSPPPGSGPYVVAEVNPGRSLTLRKNPDYWAKDHPLNRGRYNADEIRFLFYRDEAAMFEAFKTGEIDVYLDPDAGHWANAYDFPAVRDGRVVRDVVPTGTPRGMYAFVFNTRRPPFDDIRVRQALNLMFDWPWINANLFHGQLTRTTSYFEASELRSTGHPATGGERDMLAPFPAAVSQDVLDGTWAPSSSDGSGRDRATIRQALTLLAEAGWRIEGTELVNADGQPFRFEFLVSLRDDERLALAFQRLLAPIGVRAEVRYVDSGQYNSRMLAFDFDVARVFWPASLSPGNEQLHRWSTAAATTEGSFNYAGAKEPAVDAMIAAMLSATTQKAFADAVRALDRVLLSGVYVVPLYHSPAQWVARWSRVGRPERQSLAGVELETWWVKQ